MKEKINIFLSKYTGYSFSKSNLNPVIVFFQSKWAQTLNIKTVIDVGANAGQFAESVRKANPNINIISFEPLPSEYQKLTSLFKNDMKFQSYQCALGENEGTVSFMQNDFSPTSSLLEFTSLQKDFYPATGENKKIEVKISRLDEIIKIPELQKNILLKIDVQGFEDNVIKGAKGILNNILMIYIECSFKEFYKGQPLFDDIYRLLYAEGFIFKGVVDQLNAGKNNEPTQIDAIFVRKNFYEK